MTIKKRMFYSLLGVFMILLNIIAAILYCGSGESWEDERWFCLISKFFLSFPLNLNDIEFDLILGFLTQLVIYFLSFYGILSLIKILKSKTT